MQISREMMIRELEAVRKDLTAMIKELRTPTILEQDGTEIEEYPGGVPKGLSVNSFQAIPVEQFRAKLTVSAAKLEAIAST